MSVAIIYQSQRKVIKLSPNTLLQQVLEESLAALDGNFEISKCSLRYKRNFIDLSLPFRYSNIPNNASLELEVNSRSNVSLGSSVKLNNSKNVCRVALSIEGTTGSLMETFDSNLSLYHMLEHFIKNGQLSSNILESSPELIYLRSAISSQESLMKTTFSSLGLSGG
jgi:tether containing UBX domain for GLUT4